MGKIEVLYQHFIKHPRVSTDSRLDVRNTIFFSLSGENFNGNAFAASAIEKGACLAVIDDPEYNITDQYFLVDNVLETLQQLANYHRKHFSIPIIAITGSNGKTTTKEIVATVLNNSYKTNSTKGNLNNHIGVPLTLLALDKTTEIAVVEMGANHIDEINQLCQIAEPDVGIITNIGKAHIEGFGSLDGVIQAKSEMYAYIRTKGGEVIVNADDELLMSLSTGIKQISYGSSGSADIVANMISTNPFVKIDWSFEGKVHTCNSQLYGKYNFYNILAAIAIGVKYKVPPKIINSAIESYRPANNRSQQLNTKTNKIILDAYNANPVSMREAILSFNEYNPENPCLVLGDMFELGHLSNEEHKKIIELLMKEMFTNVLLVGKDFFQFKNTHPYQSFESTEDAILYLKRNPITHSNVLIKGSRGMALEKLIEHL